MGETLRNIRILSRYTFADFVSKPAFQIFLLVEGMALLGIILSPKLPLFDNIRVVPWFIFLVSFPAFTSPVVIDRFERPSVNFILSHPFTRTQVLLGTFIGVVLAMASLPVFFYAAWFAIAGIRVEVWDPAILAQGVSLVVIFISLLGYIILTGMLMPHAPAITLFWSLYVMFGATLLHARSFNFFEVEPKGDPDLLLEILFYVTPAILDISNFFKNVVRTGYGDPLATLTSLGGATLCMILSCRLVGKRDLG